MENLNGRTPFILHPPWDTGEGPFLGLFSLGNQSERTSSGTMDEGNRILLDIGIEAWDVAHAFKCSSASSAAFSALLGEGRRWLLKCPVD